MASQNTTPKHFGILLFPGFEALDAFGPMEVINTISIKHEITFSVVAEALDPVTTLWKGRHSVGQSVVPTHTFTDAPDLDVLVIPGGNGAAEPSEALLQYLRGAGPKIGQILTVCNGATLAARTGLLDGKSATTNKAWWKRCVASSSKVNWIAQARWVEAGNVWTSSGVSAGIDMLLAWTGSVYGEEEATDVANELEFTRATSSTDDPFAKLYDCEDVPVSS